MKIDDIINKYTQFPKNNVLFDFVDISLGSVEHYKFDSFVDLNIFTEDQLKRIMFYIYDDSEVYKLEHQLSLMLSVSQEVRKDLSLFLRNNIIRYCEIPFETFISIIFKEIAYQVISTLRCDILYTYHLLNYNTYDLQFLRILDQLDQKYNYDMLSITPNNDIQYYLKEFKFQFEIFHLFILNKLDGDDEAITNYKKYSELYKERYFSPLQIHDLIQKKFSFQTDVNESEVSTITYTFDESLKQSDDEVINNQVINIESASEVTNESVLTDFNHIDTSNIKMIEDISKDEIKDNLNPHELNRPILHKIENKITAKHASIFIEKIFMKDEQAFINFMALINQSDSWNSVRKDIDILFKQNNINLYSNEAIMFTDLIQTHFA